MSWEVRRRYRDSSLVSVQCVTVLVSMIHDTVYFIFFLLKYMDDKHHALLYIIAQVSTAPALGVSWSPTAPESVRRNTGNITRRCAR